MPCARSPLARAFPLAALAGVLAGPACDLAEDDVPRIVADRTSHAIVSQTNLAFTAEIFSFPPTLAFEDAALARPRAVELLRDRVLALDLNCDPEIVVNDASIITRFRDDCRVGPLRLEGEVEASVEIEMGAGPCPSGSCPTAVLWTIDDFDIQLGPELGPELAERPRLSGPVTLRDPVDPAAAMTWTTHEGFVLENRFGTFAADSFAQWNIDRDGCVVFTLESRLDRLEHDEPVDAEIGTIVVQADRVRRCPARCPDAGRLRLAFGAGQLLEWTYGGPPGDGDDKVDVIAPRGHRFARPLACL